MEGSGIRKGRVGGHRWILLKHLSLALVVDQDFEGLMEGGGSKLYHSRSKSHLSYLLAGWALKRNRKGDRDGKGWVELCDRV